ncbi:calcium-binding protein [Bauldia sp.]|uniref:calcium-binding protein n=1 Tax=Bauldia sp. TaxID=2575872 RepID=UPI003BAC61D3
MAFLDAPKKINNSNLSELKKLEDRRLLFDSDEKEYFTRKGKYEFRLTGDIDRKDGKYKGDVKSIKVLKSKDGKYEEVYRLSQLDIKYQDLIKAIKKGELSEFLKKEVFDKKDTIEGSFANDKLFGFDGGDKINGYGGNDVIRGGRGNDELQGWTGKDKFVFDTKLNAKSNVDKIVDWNTTSNKGGGKDSIWLDASIFTVFKGKKGEELKKKFFVVGNKAKDDNDYIIYNEDKGNLFYDFDAAGGEDKIKFAKIQNKKSLSHDDFDII